MSLEFDLHCPLGDFELNAAATLDATGVTAILGPSGSGKTTLLRAIAGLEKAAVGRVRFADEAWLENGKAVPPEKRRIGYVFQHAALFSHLSVAENLDYALRRARGTRHSRSDIVDATETGALLQRRSDTLSGGERQRVALARALCSQPRLLLLDEPLAAVDAAAKQRLLAALEHSFATFEIPALYVTHHRSEAARLSRETLVLSDGKLQHHGPTAALLSPIGPLRETDDASDFTLLSVAGRQPADDGLTALTTEIGTLLLPDDSLAPQQKNLLLPAREIGLSAAPIPESTFLNQIEATVLQIAQRPGARCLVTLKAKSGGSFHALITQRSATALAIVPGQVLTALVKSVVPHSRLG